jgi:hypothetical protein
MLYTKKLTITIMCFALAGLFAGSASAVNEKTVTWLSTDSDVGQRHIWMYDLFGNLTDDPATCLSCHNDDSNQPTFGSISAPPFLSFKGVNMHEGRACVECHLDGIFLNGMGNLSQGRCEDCHEVSEDRTEGKNSDKD